MLAKESASSRFVSSLHSIGGVIKDPLDLFIRLQQFNQSPNAYSSVNVQVAGAPRPVGMGAGDSVRKGCRVPCR
jgi:hypothetical protein